MKHLFKVMAWPALILLCAVPLFFAATSPLLAWRDPTYILAGFAGVVALALLLMQPLLIAGVLPGLMPRQMRRLHRVLGGALTALVILHVGGLWITSPPDVIDALLFSSPTPFSAWGVLAMWAVFGSVLLALLRRRLQLRLWRALHTVLAVVIVGGTIVHAVLIQGTMEPISKAVLCAVVFLATLKTIADLRGWLPRLTLRQQSDGNAQGKSDLSEG